MKQSHHPVGRNTCQHPLRQTLAMYGDEGIRGGPPHHRLGGGIAHLGLRGGGGGGGGRGGGDLPGNDVVEGVVDDEHLHDLGQEHRPADGTGGSLGACVCLLLSLRLIWPVTFESSHSQCGITAEINAT